jgi:hypothetical protein
MFWIFFAGAAQMVDCPPAKGVFVGDGVRSTALCYEPRPHPFPSMTIA